MSRLQASGQIGISWSSLIYFDTKKKGLKNYVFRLLSIKVGLQSDPPPPPQRRKKIFTFTGLGLEDLLWATALVLHCLDDDSSGASSPPRGFEAPPLQAGQLARAPGWPHSQMAISFKTEKFKQLQCEKKEPKKRTRCRLEWSGPGRHFSRHLYTSSNHHNHPTGTCISSR